VFTDGSARFSPDALAILPVYGAFRLAGLDRDGAYQGLFAALFVLGFVCAHIGLRRLGCESAVAGLAALAFATAASALGAAFDPSLLTLFAAPAGVCCFVRWAREGELKDFALTCAAVVVQFYGSFPLGLVLCSSLGVVALGWLAANRRMGPAWDVFTAERVAACLAAAGLAVLPAALAHSGPYFALWAVPPMPKAFEALPSFPDFFAVSGSLGGSQPHAPPGGDPGAVPAAALAFSSSDIAAWLAVLAGVASAFAAVALAVAASRASERAASPARGRAAYAVALAAVAAASFFPDPGGLSFDKSARALEVARLGSQLAVVEAGGRKLAFAAALGDSSAACQSAVAAMLAAQDAGFGCASVVARLFPAGYRVFPSPGCGQVGAFALAAWAAPDGEAQGGGMLFSSRGGPGTSGASGPGKPGASANAGVGQGGAASSLGAAGQSDAGGCLPAPMDARAARSELIRRFSVSGSIDELMLALGMKGFSPTAGGGLILADAGEFTLAPWEMLSLEGIALRPATVRLLADGKPSGRLDFLGSPTRVALSAPGKPVRYRLVVERAGSGPSGSGLDSRILFTKAVFRPGQTPQ
jgi:hypothetical protein